MIGINWRVLIIKIGCIFLPFCLWGIPSFAAELGGTGVSSGEALTGSFAISAGTLSVADSATIPPLNITERSSAPSGPATGDLYLDDGTGCSDTKPCWKRYTGAAWEELGDGGGGGGGSSRWTDEATFSRTDDDTISITTADCTNYAVHTPVRFSADESTWYYAVVASCSDAGATINVDIDGHPIETDKDDYLNYGVPEVLQTVQFIGVGNCGVSDTWFPKYLWSGPDAYLVRIYLFVDTAPTGAALQGNVECNSNNALDTEFSIAASGTSTDSGVTVDDTTYSNAEISPDEFVEIDVSQCGSTIPGGNAAWAKLLFVVP